MSTNPNTKTYWRRVSRMARKLAFRLSFKYSDKKSVIEIIAAVDPKATRTMRDEAVKMAIEDCSQSAQQHTEEAEQYRVARATLREFRDREPVSLRVIDGGTAEAIRLRWPAVEG